MQTELITADNINKYFPLLLLEEFYGIRSGRVCGFGAYDKSSGIALGVIIAQIYDDYIRIRRIYALPDYRRQGVGETLLKLITKISGSVEFDVFINSLKSYPDFLLNRDFEETDSSYNYIYSRPCDVSGSALDDEHRTGYEVLTADSINDRVLANFVFNRSFDPFMQFPEGIFDRERFSDGSIVVKKNDEIVAVVLIEEPDECVQISWMSGSDSVALEYAFSVAVKELEAEYGSEESFRVLVCSEKERQSVEGLFDSFRKEQIRIFRLEK